MIPVMQTIHGKEKGNCLQAAIASVMEVDLDALPDLWEAEAQEQETGVTWWAALRKAVEGHGWGFTWIQQSWTSVDLATVCPPGFVVAGGESPRAKDGEDHPGHAVVWLDGEPCHDPHPDGNFLDGPPSEFYLLIPPRGWRHHG